MSNAIVLGWNRATPGREKHAMEQFMEFQGWLAKQQQNKTIESHQTVLLAAHGGDLNGFVLITGEPEKLGKLTMGDEWVDFMIRGGMNMMGLGATQAYVGAAVPKLMEKWGKYI